MLGLIFLSAGQQSHPEMVAIRRALRSFGYAFLQQRKRSAVVPFLVVHPSQRVGDGVEVSEKLLRLLCQANSDVKIGILFGIYPVSLFQI